MSKNSLRLVKGDCVDAFYHEHTGICRGKDGWEVWHCPDKGHIWVQRWITSTTDTPGYYEYCDIATLRLTFMKNKSPVIEISDV